jgi:hypothetical protein
LPPCTALIIAKIQGKTGFLLLQPPAAGHHEDVGEHPDLDVMRMAGVGTKIQGNRVLSAHQRGKPQW